MCRNSVVALCSDGHTCISPQNCNPLFTSENNLLLNNNNKTAASPHPPRATYRNLVCFPADLGVSEHMKSQIFRLGTFSLYRSLQLLCADLPAQEKPLLNWQK